MQKERAIIFGAAGTGQKIYNQIKDTSNVLCYLENNETLWGSKIDGVEVRNPKDILDLEFDSVYIGSMCGMVEIVNQLKMLGIPESRMVKDVALVQVKSRTLFLHRTAEMLLESKIQGSVAEAGVYKGEFAKEINSLFPEKRLYLFDTFEGFTEADVSHEAEKSLINADYLKDTSVEEVLAKMPYKDQCIVCKGYFPDTAVGINDTFCFVSLDMDLYKPTLEGLKFFYPRMEQGGIIALHDYFSDAYPNIKRAVDEYRESLFTDGIQLKLCPIGDDISIAIIK